MPNKTRSTYHHGDLRKSLIDAAEILLAERGADAFSLREVARSAGVSPAAPAHHFGDAAGLLSAVSTAGFLGLTRALQQGERDAGQEADARSRLVGQGIAYVGFALAKPGQFRQMFRSGLQDPAPDLLAASSAAFGMLEAGIRAVLASPPAKPLDTEARTALVTMWSLVHGFAHLAIARHLGYLAHDAPLDAWISRTLRAALEAAVVGIAGPKPLPPPKPGATKSRARRQGPADSPDGRAEP